MKSLCAAIGVLLCLISRTGSTQDLWLMEPNSAMAIDLSREAARWRAAVLRKDRAALIRWAWPEKQLVVGRELRRPQSNMAKVLWDQSRGADRSAIAFFRKAKNWTDVAVFRREVLTAAQRSALGDNTQYATICYVERRRGWPSTYVELQQINNWNEVLCLDWVRDGERWRLDYGFGFPDEGDEREE